ncbi:MAG: hypothetical protein ACREDP_18945 [Bradyrhizobium sp.]
MKRAVSPMVGDRHTAVDDDVVGQVPQGLKVSSIRPFAVVGHDIRASLFELIEEGRKPVAGQSVLCLRHIVESKAKPDQVAEMVAGKFHEVSVGAVDLGYDLLEISVEAVGLDKGIRLRPRLS